MSSKRGKQKEVVEEDFEAFVRHRLSSIKSTGEDCIAKLRDIIENDLQLQSNIENAHRIGPFKDDGTPRPIWLSFCIVRNGLELLKRRGIYVMVCAFRMI
ncbi:unnamed protein product [Porites lobata]|uniref:Uncharacterized protein n=1 Tax=Porites lobata TaxID=104759 RepID=A0ABN8PUB8_9CNID|nr:unnamed protein product [Porites lobata]